jgi:hypothetical protein
MRLMNERKTRGIRVGKGAFYAVGLRLVAAGVAAGVAACGGGAKGADSPGTCPDGTVLKGSDCVPATAGHASDDSTSSSESTSSGSSSSSSSTDSTPSGSTGNKTPYDKDSVEIELKRASRQVKANCGSATDDSGAASGPWGKTSASVTLGRNGHVKSVTVPAPYDGQPEGVCAINAFQKIQFPPYASSADVVVEWDIEFVKPKH